MDDPYKLAADRVRRFQQTGGGDLARLDPEERHLLLAEVRVGLALAKKGWYTFECPVCRNRADSDQEAEPMCTGPHPSLDEHEPTVMDNLTLALSAPRFGLDGATVLYERVAP